MKRGKWKEAVLLLLPVAAMMCVALWWQQKEKRGDIDNGPLRVEIGSIEKITPTPAEVAEGYDTKILVTLAYRGNDPLSFYRRGRTNYAPYTTTKNLKIQVREKQQWRDVALTTTPLVREVDRDRRDRFKENQVVFLLPLSQLPKKDLRLQFIAESQLTYVVPAGTVRPQRPKVLVFPDANSNDKDRVTVAISSPVLFAAVRKAGEAVSVPEVSRECPLSLQSAKVSAFNPTNLFGSGNPTGANRNLTFEVKGQEKRRWRGELRWKMFNAHIVDENGKIYRKWLGWKMYSPTPTQQFHDFGSSQVDQTKEDEFKFEYLFSTAFIPLSAGQLTFKAQVSVNDEWPLPLSVVVRERDDWTLKRSRTLKLKSIETKIASDDKARLDVIVKIAYNGKKKLVATSNHGHFFYIFWNMYQLDGSIPEDYPVDREPDDRLLVSHWSHRIENSHSPIPSPELQRANSGYYPVRVHSVESNKSGWKIVYRITSLRLRKVPPPLVFKADIGVEGDGFLPVSVPLPPALVAKTAATPLP